MAKVHDQEDRNTNVGCQEAGGGPLRREEDSEAVDQAEDCEGYHGDPRSVWLYPVSIDRCDVLSGAGLAESEVNDHTTHPRGHSPRISKIDKPVEDSGSVGRNVEVCKTAEQ